MRSILSLACLFLINGFAQAQCPAANTFSLTAVDTVTYYNNGATNISNVPATFSCNATPFYVYVTETGADIHSPCIKTDYDLFYTWEKNRITETFYEGGSNIGCVGPTAPCAFAVGGGTSISGLSEWSVSLYGLDPSVSHDMVVCKTGTSAGNTFTLSVSDCWNTNSPPTPLAGTTGASNPMVWNGASATSCFTITVPAGSGIGSSVFSISPAVAAPGFFNFGFGYCYINPAYLTTGTTYTLTYTFTAPGCAPVSQSKTYTVVNPYTATWSAPGPLCSAGSCVALTTSGSAGGTWSGTGVSGSQFCPATSGAGSIPVTYSVGISPTCSASQTNTITVNPTPTITPAATPTAICAGQSTDLSASGATTFTWSANATSATTASVTITPAMTDTYTVSGTTAGCSSSATVAVTVNPLPTVTAVASQTTVCSGQNSLLTAGGATSYTWSANAGSLTTDTSRVSPTSSDVYTVTGTDANSCVNTAIVAVNVTPTPTLIAGVTTGTVCAGVIDTVFVSGATSYTWMPGSTNNDSAFVNPANTTTYVVTGDAGGGCTATASVVVTITPLPSLTLTAMPASVCPGQSSTLTASGASTYTFSANAGSVTTTTASITPAGTDTYTVSATQNGCSDSTTITVAVGSLPTLTITATQTNICSGNTTTLTASGATTYTWHPGGSSTNPLAVSPASNQTYSVTGSSGGCTDSTTITINVSPTPTVMASASPATICAGETTTLTASGATTFTWMPGSVVSHTISVSPGSTQTYVVTGDSLGCTDIKNVVVTVNPAPVVLINSPTPTVCSGGSAGLLAGGTATSWTWSANAGGVTTQFAIVYPTTNPTTYSVVGAIGTCTASASYTVGVTTTPTVTATSTLSICNGDTATLVATVSPGTSTLAWSPGGSSNDTIWVNPSATTNYSVIATNGGCSDTAFTAVNVGTVPVLTLSSPSSQTVCVGGNVSGINMTTTPAGETISWSNTNTSVGIAGTGTTSIGGYPAPNVTMQQVGVVKVDVTDVASGCPGASKTFTITINPSPTLSGTPKADTAFCMNPIGDIKGLSASGGTAPLGYQWNIGGVPVTGATKDSIMNIPGGVYTLVVTDALGCQAISGGITVPSTSIVIAAFTASTYSGTASLPVAFTNNTIGATSYNWNFGTGSASTAQNPTFDYTQGGTYQVILTATNGHCSDTAMRTIIVDQPITVTVPNIFSPNGDNINEVFEVITSGVTELSCDIFNRWGQKVHTISSVTGVWDGKLDNGHNATEGTYYYMLLAKSFDGKQHKSEGTITLVK